MLTFLIVRFVMVLASSAAMSLDESNSNENSVQFVTISRKTRNSATKLCISAMSS